MEFLLFSFLLGAAGTRGGQEGIKWSQDKKISVQWKRAGRFTVKYLEVLSQLGKHFEVYLTVQIWTTLQTFFFAYIGSTIFMKISLYGLLLSIRLASAIIRLCSMALYLYLYLCLHLCLYFYLYLYLCPFKFGSLLKYIYGLLLSIRLASAIIRLCWMALVQTK